MEKRKLSGIIDSDIDLKNPDLAALLRHREEHQCDGADPGKQKKRNSF